MQETSMGHVEIAQLRAENARLREAEHRVYALPRSTMDCGTQWVRLEEVISTIRGEKQ